MSSNVETGMDDPVAHIRSLYAQQRYAETVDFIREVVSSPTPRRDDWRLIANAAITLTDRYAAAQAARRWVEEQPTLVKAHTFCADQLANAGAIEEALAFSRKMRAQFPDHAHVWFTAGGVEAQAGFLEPALEQLRKAWEIDQTFLGAWQRIARLKTFEPDDPDLPIIASLPEQAGALGPSFQIAAHFACADMYDKLGDPRRAFPHYEEAAALVRQSSPYDIDRQLSVLKNGLDAFDETLLKRLQTAGDPSPQPIFIIGPPRSGTTLVEQVLASHSQVAGGGESSALRVASWPLKDYAPGTVFNFAARGGGDQWRALGRKYLTLMSEMFGESPFVTNKDIGSIASVGLISVILPNAKIIFCSRDAMDAGWSSFKAHFGASLVWTFDFQHIARFFAAFRFARETWRERLSINALDVVYEDFVLEPRPQIDRLLTFCGLPVETACYEFHKTERQISTASITQVRQPVYTSSIGAWRQYEAFLSPLRTAMNRYALL